MLKTATVRFKDLNRWDVKTYMGNLQFHFPMVSLAPYLIENTNKIKPFELPDKKFDILGVTNKTGIYFNETLLGSQINQPYYQVNSGDIFYNPYRVNVGSVGIVPQEFHHKYTSPAYVVFKTDHKCLLSEYLVYLLQAEWFNGILRASTSGSVRQNLTFSLLGSLKIPLPPLAEQKHIVALWQAAEAQAQADRQKAEQLRQNIDIYLMKELGITIQKQKKAKIFTARFKDLERWDVDNNANKINIYSNRYPLTMLRNILDHINSESQIPSANARYIGLEHIEKETGKYIFNMTETSGIKSNSLILKPGYIYYSKLRPYLKKIIIFNDEELTYGSTELLGLKPNHKIDDKYLHEILLSSIVSEQENGTTGARMPRINQRILEEFKIPLPPMVKQQEIVGHISQLRAQIAQLQRGAQDRLDNTREQIKKIILI